MLNNDITTQYDIKLKKLHYDRSHYYLNTDKGQFLLRRVHIPKEQIYFEYEVNQQLIEKGFNQIEAICLTKKQIPYMLQQDKVYVLQTYREVDEIDLKNKEDLVGAVDLLAQFHKNARGIKSEARDIEEGNIKNIYEYFYKRRKESKKIKQNIMKLAKKSPFEVRFSEEHEAYDELEERALQLVNPIIAGALVEAAKINQTIAHNEFTYHAVGRTKEGIYVMNYLDTCTYNIQLMDVAHMLIKILQKNSWDINLLDQLIKTYLKVNTLTLDECNLLKAMLIFPDKYANICHKYMTSKRRNHYSMFEMKWENMSVYKDEQIKAAKAIEKYL